MCRRSGEPGELFTDKVLTDLGNGEAKSTKKGTVVVNHLWVNLLFSAFKILELR